MSVQMPVNSNLTKEKVAILGARGYSGAELARLSLRHPKMELAGLFATQNFEVKDLLPELAGSVATASSNGASAVYGQSMVEFGEILNSASAPFRLCFWQLPQKFLWSGRRRF